ncbi:hypothetical protein [Agromyces humi]|uniref:hypothetical protein n=1 Tax=Agromyces humi TaxID=1766800 RepID=UPI001358ED2E|nr:hypothetical protein [Agromyces humi]
MDEDDWAAEYRATLEPQQTYPPGTAWADLPDTIERKCCLYKSCGNTTIVKTAVPLIDLDSPTGSRHGYVYARESNGDYYFRVCDTVDELIERVCDTVDELIERVNDPTYWPVREG